MISPFCNISNTFPESREKLSSWMLGLLSSTLWKVCALLLLTLPSSCCLWKLLQHTEKRHSCEKSSFRTYITVRDIICNCYCKWCCLKTKPKQKTNKQKHILLLLVCWKLWEYYRKIFPVLCSPLLSSAEIIPAWCLLRHVQGSPQVHPELFALICLLRWFFPSWGWESCSEGACGEVVLSFPCAKPLPQVLWVEVRGCGTQAAEKQGSLERIEVRVKDASATRKMRIQG